MDLRLDCIPSRGCDTNVRGRGRSLAPADQTSGQDQTSRRMPAPDQSCRQSRNGGGLHREWGETLGTVQEAPQGMRTVHVEGCPKRRQQRISQDGEEQWLRIRGHDVWARPGVGELGKLDAEHPALEHAIRRELRRHTQAAFGRLERTTGKHFWIGQRLDFRYLGGYLLLQKVRLYSGDTLATCSCLFFSSYGTAFLGGFGFFGGKRLCITMGRGFTSIWLDVLFLAFESFHGVILSKGDRVRVSLRATMTLPPAISFAFFI